MPITKQTDHSGQGLGRIITPLQDKATFKAILDSYLTQIQELENAFDQLFNERFPDDATSTEMLNVLGRVVGQPREGRDNDTYRIWIKARILVNRSSGTPEEMLAIAALTSGASLGSITLLENFPASLSIDIDKVLAGLTGDQISEILHLVTPAGVGFQLEWFVDVDSFTFSDTDDTKTDALKGFGDDTITTVGGVFSSAS